MRYITIRVNDSEVEKIEKIAKQGGYINRSEFIRQAVRDKIKNEGA
ncbi:MAG: ribbon-helix-helix domain-containing protein [Candidatus Methanomethylophilus sp.]|jgi:metal-responsive CopG/Arc/MetJ family transcriptional regulator|nr:ribbon-helix-helix domain-containing protein [Methanomethylophilus sp.]MCI2092529.1 ribbon-helix-helix domain-containing protein [Methanomethylophilus sp.]